MFGGGFGILTRIVFGRNCKTIFGAILFASLILLSFMLHETHKSTGAAKDEVSELFKKFIEIQFIEVVPSKEFAFVIKKMMSLEEIKTSIENS